MIAFGRPLRDPIPPSAVGRRLLSVGNTDEWRQRPIRGWRCSFNHMDISTPFGIESPLDQFRPQQPPPSASIQIHEGFPRGESWCGMASAQSDADRAVVARLLRLAISSPSFVLSMAARQISDAQRALSLSETRHALFALINAGGGTIAVIASFYNKYLLQLAGGPSTAIQER